MFISFYALLGVGFQFGICLNKYGHFNLYVGSIKGSSRCQHGHEYTSLLAEGVGDAATRFGEKVHITHAACPTVMVALRQSNAMFHKVTDLSIRSVFS